MTLEFMYMCNLGMILKSKLAVLASRFLATSRTLTAQFLAFFRRDIVFPNLTLFCDLTFKVHCAAPYWDVYIHGGSYTNKSGLH